MGFSLGRQCFPIKANMKRALLGMRVRVNEWTTCVQKPGGVTVAFQLATNEIQYGYREWCTKKYHYLAYKLPNNDQLFIYDEDG